MKLSKYINIFAVVLLIGTTTGCSDWLDYTPKDKQTEENMFSSRDGFYSSINGVYNNLTSTTLYGANLTYGMLDFMGKRYNTQNNTSSTAYKWSQYQYADSYVGNDIENIWSGCYKTILNINIILENLEKKKDILTEKDYNVMKGDMLALRGFIHFDLLRMFGPVYKNNPTADAIPYNKSTEAKSHKILSADSVSKCILEDLNAASSLLEKSDPVISDGVLSTTVIGESNYLRYRQLRMNYYATTLLKARVYLWIGDNENALAEATKITDSDAVKEHFKFINPDILLGNTVNPDRVFSSELLFGFYYSDRNEIYKNMFDGSNLSSLNLLQPKANYIDVLFANQGDYRFQSQWTASSSFFNFVKYKEITVDTTTPEFYANLMPLMGLSEAFYIAAEASLNSDNAKAVEYLNTILKARGINTMDKESASNDILKEIKNEYIRETWGQGQIFYMFKRHFMNITSEYNAESGSNVTASNGIYVLPLPESELSNR